MDADDIRVAIEKMRLEENLAPLQEKDLDDEVNQIIAHAFMVNEIGRMILFNAFKAGKINGAEFKRRALVNNPSGQDISRL